MTYKTLSPELKVIERLEQQEEQCSECSYQSDNCPCARAFWNAFRIPEQAANLMPNEIKQMYRDQLGVQK